MSTTNQEQEPLGSKQNSDKELNNKNGNATASGNNIENSSTQNNLQNNSNRQQSESAQKSLQKKQLALENPASQDLQNQHNIDDIDTKTQNEEDPQDVEKKKEKKKNWKEQLDYLLEHNITTIIMTVITLYALFGDDIRILVTGKKGDEVFWIFNILAMVAFMVEIIISSLVKKDYWLGFFFWLDVISTASLILDIGYISQEIFQTGSDASDAKNAAALARASRASRVGTKAGRIVRIVRLIRLVKLYKHAQQALIKEADMQEKYEEEIKQQEQNQAKEQQQQIQARRNKANAKEKIKKKKHKADGENDLESRQNLEIGPSQQQIGSDQADGTQKQLPGVSEEIDKEQDGPTKPQPLNNNFLGDPANSKNQFEEEDLEKQKLNTQSKLSDKIEDIPLEQNRNEPLIQVEQQQQYDQQQQMNNNINQEEEQKPLNMDIDANKENYELKQLNTEENQPRSEHIENAHIKEEYLEKEQDNNKQQQQQDDDEQQQLQEKKQLQNSNNNEDSNSQLINKRQKSNTLTKKQETLREKKKSEAQDPELNDEDLPQETKVGQKLSDLTTKRVITLVMSIMISVPIFSADTYTEPVVSYNNGLWNLLLFTQNEELLKQAMNDYINFHKNHRSPILYIDLQDQVDFECCKIWPNENFFKESSQGVANYTNMRNDEIQYFNAEDDSGNILGFAVVDDSANYSLNAILSMIRTVFVSVILAGGAMLFSQDVEDLVLTPIEHMLKQVQSIAKNPLEAAQIEEQQAFAWEELKRKGMTKELDKKKEEEKMETSILEKLIIKIGALLALGFGEAGSEIIAENMSKKGEVDPLIPGKKMMAVFGFCDIINFQDATEVLQTDVMVYVNQIAEIAHGVVDQYAGQSNKNIGEAFLLVWRYQETQFYVDQEAQQMKLKESDYIRELTDLPIIAFLKIIAQVHLNQGLIKYRENEQLVERVPDFQVKMGYGLHIGWAIEGAIGSSFKIDASYLSPNVNMAARLEAATKQFGTMLLISGDLFNMLSPMTQEECRHIDRVTVKGSVQPMDLYTIDVHLPNLQTKVVNNTIYEPENLTMDQKKKKRVFQRIKRNKLKGDLEKGKQHISDQLGYDKELISMREPFTQEFYETWEMGFESYIDGDWLGAKEYLEETINMIPGFRDGPSNTILNYMRNRDFQAPPTWNRYRELTEK